MTLSVHTLLDELADFETLLAEASRRGGQDVEPRVERRLDAQARTVAALIDPASRRLVYETVEAAKRVMGAADPAAPRLMLEIARASLERAVRRQVARPPVSDAA